MTTKIKNQSASRRTKAKSPDGITLLLVVVILSALLSIGTGIFNLAIGQLKISGEAADSFIAFYAADQGIERTLFRDRNIESLCAGIGEGCFKEPLNDNDPGIMVDSGGCYKIRVNKTASDETQIAAFGQYRCGANPSRVVKRGFWLTYNNTGGPGPGPGSGPPPIAQWKMDELPPSSTVADSSGNGHTGIANGTTIVAGISGNARSFNGTSDHISLPDIGLGEAPPFTIEAWVKPASTHQGSIYSEANTSLNNPGSEIYVGADSKVWVFYRNDAGTTIPSFRSSRIYTVGAWNHVVFIARSSSSFELYLNGALEDTSADTISGLTLTNANIGVYKYLAAPSGTSFFSGAIDEVRIYSTALTAVQVCDNYKATSGQTSCSGDQFIFSLSNNGNQTLPLYYGSGAKPTVESTITVTITSGSPEPVSLSLVNDPFIPTGVTATFNPTSCTPNPTCTSQLRFRNEGKMWAGWWTAKVYGTAGTATNNTNFQVTVPAPACISPMWTIAYAGDTMCSIKAYHHDFSSGGSAPYYWYINDFVWPGGTSALSTNERYIDPGGGIESPVLPPLPKPRISTVIPNAVQQNGSANYRVKVYRTFGNMPGFVACTGDYPDPIITCPFDGTAPSAVTNLAASGAKDSSINLNWTAPGDDGNIGTAASYDIRYSTSAITDANWGSATQATGEPTPIVAGFSQSMTVSGLSSQTLYYFAIKTSDEALNVSALSNVPSLQTTPPSALIGIALWKMDSPPDTASTVVDSSGNGHTGTANGTTIVAGISGNARSFNGANDYVDTAAKTWGISNNLTVSAWIYPTLSATGGEVIWSIGNNGDYNKVGILYLREGGGLGSVPELALLFYDNVGGTVYRRAFSLNDAVPLNTWSYVTGVVQSNEMYVYVNGVDVSSSRDGGGVSLSDVSRKVFLGKWPTGNSTWFQGKIDEVAFHNTALTATQVCDNYKATSGRTSCP